MYDVIIIGAGPAGIFAALELQLNSNLKVLILEKGRSLGRRYCPAHAGGGCVNCNPCMITSGWGGAGAFSDGKLSLSPASGGYLGDILGEEKAQELITEVDKIYTYYGANSDVFGEPSGTFKILEKKFGSAGLELVPVPIRHIGTERCGDILSNLWASFQILGIYRQLRSPVERILTSNGKVVGVKTKRGDVFLAEYVIIAPGREGASWLKGVAASLELSLTCNPVDLGIRVELPATVLAPITDILYEFKALYRSRAFDDQVRTFCVCPYGEVTTEFASGVVTVNGHSYADRKTANTNFALLVSKSFTEPFDDPIAYGKAIARLANLLGDGVLVQRLVDLEMGQRSTVQRLSQSIVTPTLSSATPGDLALVFPYRYIINILEMLHALDRVAPGVYSRNTLLYGVEVKFYSNRLKLTAGLETEISNLYACGDGAGITRGLIQASASGLIAARSIMG